MEPFKLALIGCGRIAHSWLEAIRQTAHVQLVSCMDINKAVIEPIRELTGCAVFDSLEKMLKDIQFDGAILCTPPSTHFSIAQKLLKSKIHVLCEKPLALTVKEGEMMYKTAKENDVTLMMASKFRYIEDLIQAKSIIATGTLGNIHFYQNQFCTRIDMANRWNANPKLSGGGVIMDNGPHAVDIIRYLLGPIKKIHAHESTKSHGLTVEDTATLSIITQQQVIATIHLSWALNIHSNAYIEIFGTEGALKVGWEGSAYQYNSRADWIPFGMGYQKIAAFKSQLENFVQTAQKKATPLINEEDSLASIQLIEAAYQSLKCGDFVEV